MKNDSAVTLGPCYEQFIIEQVAKGRYGFSGEAILAGLRLLEEPEAKVSLLLRALDKVEGNCAAGEYLKSWSGHIDAKI
jgi:antitoxin ParD1/3/4